MVGQHGIIDVRGVGLMIGIEFSKPISDIRKRLIFDKKVFTGASGTSVLRLLPPLCLTKTDVDLFISRFNELLTEME